MARVELESAAWDVARAADAMTLLALRSRLPMRGNLTVAPPAALAGAAFDRSSIHDLRRWMAEAAESIELETYHADLSYEQLAAALEVSAPAVVWWPRRDLATGSLLVLLRCDRRRSVLLLPDASIAVVPLADLCVAIAGRQRDSVQAWADGVLSAALGRERGRREHAAERLIAQRLRGVWVTAAWSLRPAPHGSLLVAVRQAGVLRGLARLAFHHLLAQVVWIAAWIVLGRAALEGTVDRGWLWGSILLLFLVAPLRMASAWWQGVVTVAGGGLVKSWLLCGALQLRPDEVRRHGHGELVGKALEAGAFESQSIDSLFLLLLAALELVVVAAVFVAGAAPWLSLLALLAWLAAALATAARYRVHLRTWTELRLAMTGLMVEQMVGYRTRIVQQPRPRWHDEEDRQLHAYVRRSESLDRWHAAVRSLPAAWPILGIASLVPSFLAGGSLIPLAVSIGGVVLMAGASARLTEGVLGLMTASTAFRQIAPMLAARRRHQPAPPPWPGASSARPGEPMVELREVTCRHDGTAVPILDRCHLSVAAGERILVEGGSGAGKSTLASLVAGLARPDSGLVTFRGLDLDTLGENGWRRAVAFAPQFHLNHVFSGTLLFNLLLGDWPLQPAHLDEAVEVCRELGLGPLLARMPGGLLQFVGESGWQLSHGERSRIFIARALLQRSEVVILDESFAALDPATLELALACSRRRSRTLIVIAHP